MLRALDKLMVESQRGITGRQTKHKLRIGRHGLLNQIGCADTNILIAGGDNELHAILLIGPSGVPVYCIMMRRAGSKERGGDRRSIIGRLKLQSSRIDAVPQSRRLSRAIVKEVRSEERRVGKE